MIFEHIPPTGQLGAYIESFWLIDGEGDSSIHRQKIIPDGFPELIFHYGDPYRTNVSGEWVEQGKSLLAGQIRNHFYLENTGLSGMVGVKFKPAALSKLFGLHMGSFTDSVVPLSSVVPELSALHPPKLASKSEFIEAFEDTITKKLLSIDSAPLMVEIALELLHQHKGAIPIHTLVAELAISERKLERQFQQYVGLSPKFYARIIRLGHIFQLMQDHDQTWSDLVYRSGFYDQSHFIKNFKEFTGEDPSAYGFEEKNMANFHLKK